MPHTSAESSNKSTSKSAATHRKVSGKSADSRTGSGNGVDRQEMIAVAAYYRAEHRGFDCGDPMADWLAAEAEIDATLNNPPENAVH